MNNINNNENEEVKFLKKELRKEKVWSTIYEVFSLAVIGLLIVYTVQHKMPSIENAKEDVYNRLSVMADIYRYFSK